jgi:hypothetical protein
MSEKMSISQATGMPIAGKKQLSPMQQAALERTFYSEFRRRIKAGEPAPFAGMMAARQQLIERNRIMDEWPRLGEV